MTQPDRAVRLWLAVAVAILWLLSVGGEVDATLSVSTFLDVTALVPQLDADAACYASAVVEGLSLRLDLDPGGVARPGLAASGLFRP